MAAPVYIPPLRDGDRLTRDEFMRRWEAMPELHRAELIDGVVHLPSPVSLTHSDLTHVVSFWTGAYQITNPHVRAGANGTWHLPGHNVPQPDIALWVRQEQGGRVRIVNDYPVGAPELIIEVSKTTSARDRGAKLEMYRRSGVNEYMTIHPRQRKIVWRELADGQYVNLPVAEDGWFRSRIFPGLWLDPEALWNSDLAGLAAAVKKGIAATRKSARQRKK